MTTLSFKRMFDVVEFLRNSCLTGAGFGRDAAVELQKRIALEGPNCVWVVDLTRSIAIDYRFISNFLGHVLDPVAGQGGVSSLPTNTVLLIRCRFATARKNVIDGLSWRKGDKELPAEKDAIERIQEKRRYCTLIDVPADGSAGSPFYLGTTEPELLDLLMLVEKMGKSRADELPRILGRNTQETMHAIDKLEERRLLFRQPALRGEESTEPTYLSITTTLREETL